MDYPNGRQDGREDGKEARERVATEEDRFVPRLLLCLRDGNLYGHRLEERLGEMGFGEMHPSEMYRLLWQMEQEGMVFCNREGGGYSVPQRWYALTEVGEAYLESYVGLLARREGEGSFQSSKTSGSGRGGDAGEG